MSIYDCWTKENQWLSRNDIRQMLNLKCPSSEYTMMSNELINGEKLGILETRPRRRKLKGRNCYYYRVVKEYKPKKWVLKSICNGFFEEKSKEFDKKYKR